MDASPVNPIGCFLFFFSGAAGRDDDAGLGSMITDLGFFFGAF